MTQQQIHSSDIEIAINGHTVPAFQCLPSGDGPFPGVVVIQEWWGLEPHIKDITERFARQGFAALAPDLYHGEVPSKVREQAVIPATVDVLEPLGAESLVHAKTDRQTFTMRIDVPLSVSVGEQMEVTLDLDAIHLFDNTTDDETQARNLTLDDSVTQPAAVGTEA